MAPKPKEKSKPSPASSTQSPPLEDLFATLNRHVQDFEFAKAAKLADQVLAIAPGDEDAIRCKVVALIKSDLIDKALDAIKRASSPPIDLSFCKAYCLYRQNKLEEALDSIRAQEKTPMVLQLESQIFYRMRKMDSCIESYEKLQKFKIESVDLKANTIAALVASGRSGEVDATMMSALKVKSSRSFEIVYNAACALIEKKKYTEAEQLLLSARRIGQENLMNEDYADDEIETELAPVAVQLAYVRQLMGHSQESTDEYNGVISRNLGDASSLAIATNNLIALRNGKEVSDSLRKLDKLISKGNIEKPFELSNGLDFQLNPNQKEAIYSNRVLLLLQANKIDQAQELVSALQEMYPKSITPILLQAAVFVREKKVPKAEEILSQYCNTYPKNCTPVLLALAQISATAGHFQISSEALSKVAEIQHMPATVATLVSLWERLGDFSNSASVLDASIEWWKNAMDGEKNLSVIMQEAASFKLKYGKEGDAAKLYEELVKSSSSKGSVDALVGLVQTAAKSDLEKAERYEKQLKPLPGLKGVNVEALEKTSGAKHVEGGTHAAAKMEISDEVKKAKAKKRKRKPKYPKGFDPANPGPPPDPERWLPKRERSTYRPKRKDKRAQIRGAQGAVSRDNNKHDAAATTTTSGASGTGTGTGGATSSKAGSSKGGGSQSAVVGNAEQNKGGSNKSRKKKSRN